MLLVLVTKNQPFQQCWMKNAIHTNHVRCICRHLVHLYDNMKDDLLIPNGWRSPITFERVRKLTIPKQSHQQKCKFDDRSFTTWWFQICFLHPKFWGNGPISQIFVQMG